MKRSYSVLFVAGLFLAACSNNNKSEQKTGLSASLVNNPRSAEGTDPAKMQELPTMDFADTTHDFGPMHEGEMSSYDFHFKNNGKQPLIISKASGSCGCTIPDYPHEPVVPGQSAVIKVKFNSLGKIGHQNKSVTIMTNSNKGTHLLYITADVINDTKE